MSAPRKTLDRLFGGSPGLSGSEAVGLTRRALLAAGCLCLACNFATPLLAATPIAKSQVPGFHRLQVGAFAVTALSDGTNMLPATKLLQGDTARIEEALQRDHLGDVVETSHNCFLIDTGAKLVLIDAGAGTLLGPSSGHLLESLGAAGYRPEQIDELYLTHLHADHVGGLMADGKRAFPNAVVRADKRDIDYWLSEANMRAAPAEAKRFFQAAMASITPYISAGKLAVFEGDTDLAPGVRAQAAYGHTPGHTMYVVESKGEKIILWGDVVHVAAVQFKDPSVTIQYDENASAAERVHELMFADAAQNGYIVGGAHIAFPGLGRVRRDGNAYEFVPLSDG